MEHLNLLPCQAITLDNIYYLNGVRQDPNAFLVYATGVGLIEGTGIEIESKGTIVYNKDVSYGSD